MRRDLPNVPRQPWDDHPTRFRVLALRVDPAEAAEVVRPYHEATPAGWARHPADKEPPVPPRAAPDSVWQQSGIECIVVPAQPGFDVQLRNTHGVAFLRKSAATR